MLYRGITLFLLALLLAPCLLAQDQSSSQHLDENVSVGYVMIPFTVLGRHSAPITDLDAREVSLLVDDVPVKSDMFEKSMDAPVSFTILVDGSGSMALSGKMEAARAAVEALIAGRKPGDDFSLFVFDATEAHEIVPFTDNPQTILTAMYGIKPWGKTAFFDAVSTMPEKSRLGRNPTRAIILLSDGIDNASTLTREQLSRTLEGLGIPIYSLGLREAAEAKLMTGQTAEASSDIALLEDVATQTGGRLFLGNRPEQLGKAVDRIENDLRAQYLMGFTPTGKGAVKYRRISLKVAGRVQAVRVRAGYRGTEPPVLTKANERKRS
ncbi:MAG TPA: VWA domain-containing protein [Thermoanaerobaculia bacterium]|nr:VWA domain-containing protein [Thermoanaerobaculia bacterium]